MEDRSRGSATYYDIFINSTLSNKLRRIVWGYLPYLIVNVEDESLYIFVDWKK